MPADESAEGEVDRSNFAPNLPWTTSCTRLKLTWRYAIRVRSKSASARFTRTVPLLWVSERARYVLLLRGPGVRQRSPGDSGRGDRGHETAGRGTLRRGDAH
jgi:hypothetical protein